MAFHTFDGVSGMSRCVTPSAESASSAAFTTAGGTAMLPVSPRPFAPSTFSGVGVSVCSNSGTGKSVLLRTILGLKRPEGGAIEIFGQRLDALQPRERRLTQRRAATTRTVHGHSPLNAPPVIL